MDLIAVGNDQFGDNETSEMKIEKVNLSIHGLLVRIEL